MALNIVVVNVTSTVQKVIHINSGETWLLNIPKAKQNPSVCTLHLLI